MTESRIWTHHLTPGLVSCLVKAIQFVRANDRNEFHLQRDLNLTHSEFTNFQKLRHWALVAQVKDKRGYWLITNWGGQFLRGELDTPIWVNTQNNHRIEKATERVHISHFRGKIPEFQSDFVSEPAKVESHQPALIP
jgi:hypothetical protein